MSQQTVELIIQSKKNIQEVENLLYSFVRSGKLLREEYEDATDHSKSLEVYLDLIKKRLLKK